MDKNKKQLGNKFGIALKGILALFTGVVSVFMLLYPQRIKRFLRGEKREIGELVSGKESFDGFIDDSSSLLRDFFIPHSGNEYKPKALRPRSLAFYALAALMVKALLTGFLFFSYPSPARLSAIVSEAMVSLINESRIESGEEPLVINTDLVAAATLKGQDMLNRQYFAHDTPEGTRPWEWIDQSSYDYVYAGENLAMDFTSAEAVHTAFLKSPSHQRNILNPKYREVGIAVLNGELNGRETILLVEYFGTQRKDASTLAAAQPVPQPPSELVNTNTSLNQPTVAGESVVAEPMSQKPEEALAAGSANEAIIVVAPEQHGSATLIDLVIEYSNIFFIAFILFVLLSLLINIFVKIRIQHASVILQSVALVALLLAMLLVKLHFLEQMAPQLLIL